MATKKKKKVKADPKKVLFNSLLELIRKTSAELPEDVSRVVIGSLEKEEKNTTAEYALKIIKHNIELAKKKSQPICQDTGTVICYVDHPLGFSQLEFKQIFQKAIVKATELGYLRQNSVDSVSGANSGMNLGPGHPSIHFHEHKSKEIKIRLMLKGGGCENVSAQYSLPQVDLGAGRDLKGVRKVILDAVHKAQGQGCGPGALGVCIGGDRADSSLHAKEQLFRFLDDENGDRELNALENEIVETCNKLGIGPMGFGGKTTLLACKISKLNRVPASFFVSISYMCWAFRRQGIKLKPDNTIKSWIY